MLSLIFLAISAPKVLADNDQNKRIFAYLNAVNFYQNGDTEKAIKLLLIEEKQASEHPLNNEINFMLSICYFDLEYWEKAINRLNSLDSFEALNDYILFLKAYSHKELGKLKKSLTFFETLIEAYPKSRWYKAALQNAFLVTYQLKNYRRAVTLFARRKLHKQYYPLEDQARIPEMFYSYAKANQSLKRHREANKFFKLLIINYPASSYAKEAQEIFSKSKKAFSNYELKRLIKSQTSNGLSNEAAKNLELLSKRRINKEVLTMLRGSILMRTRKWEKAIKVLKSVFHAKAHPNIMYNLGKCYNKLDDYPRARYYFRKLVSAYPRHNLAPHALLLAAKLYTHEGNFANAIKEYDIFLKKYPRHDLATSAIWEKGWNYYKFNKFDEAILIWTNASELLKKDDILLSKYFYWRARAFENQGDKRSASILYREIVNRFPFHYYAFQAQNRLLENTSSNYQVLQQNRSKYVNIIEATKKISCKTINLDKFKSSLSHNEKHFFSKAQHLIKVGLDKYASYELYRIQASTRNKDTLFDLSKFFYCLHDYNRAQYIARVFFEDKFSQAPSMENIDLWRLAYPDGFSRIISKLSNHLNFSPYLILALMRAESNFKANAFSPVGAMGLMQIMPNTGKQIAKKLKDKNFITEHLLDPKTNIAFGSWYFNSLTEKFDGNTILAIPSYNAGPHNVKKWVRQFGSLKVDEFIESIPYHETRNYVKRVVRNFGVYRTLYSKNKSILRLTQILHVNKDKLRLPAGENKNKEDWDQYKETEDPRHELFFIHKFSLDKLQLIEYFSLNSFKNDVKSRSFLRR